MKIEQILSMNTTDKDKLGMILSKNADMGSSEGCLISVKAFDRLIVDLIKWKSAPSNQGKSKMITITSGIWSYGGYEIRHAQPTGGKTGKGYNRTTTLQVVELVPYGYVIKKIFKFILGNKESFDNAENKCISWIEKHPK